MAQLSSEYMKRTALVFLLALHRMFQTYGSQRVRQLPATACPATVGTENESNFELLILRKVDCFPGARPFVARVPAGDKTYDFVFGPEVTTVEFPKEN